MTLDEIDVKILDILQRNGRTRRNDLAVSVGLSLRWRISSIFTSISSSV
ncbi:MAG TPA: AsnC family transcriptional regulator, partial [Bacteroidota bacterium]